MAEIDKHAQEIEEALSEQPMLDVHTHVDAAHLTARGLHDILLYHMVLSDLYAAGCPCGQRLSEWPDDREAWARLEQAVPYMPRIRNTSCCWGVRAILRDLYGWDEPLTAENWRRADAVVRERSRDGSWARQLMRRARVKRIGTELTRRGDGSADDILLYSVESAFFTRLQKGQNDAPLYELERTWHCEELPTPVSVNLDAATRPQTPKCVRNVADARSAMAHYCKLVPFGKVLATAQHLSTDIRYRRVTDGEMEQAIRHRDHATEADRDTYASYLLDLFLTELSGHEGQIVYQFSLGAEPLPFESASRLGQQTIAELAGLLERYPRVSFMAFLSSRHGNQSLCTLARELPNLSLAGYWWHNFFPDAIRQVMNERLDMLPVNKQVGFFSDAYCLDWTYAKAIIVKKQLAGVLAAKVAQGQYSVEDALGIANSILLDTPRDLLKMTF
jgi:glucuronate isomerase